MLSMFCYIVFAFLLSGVRASSPAVGPELCERIDYAGNVVEERSCAHEDTECTGGPISIVVNAAPMSVKFCQVPGLNEEEQSQLEARMRNTLLMRGACRVENANGDILHVHACKKGAECKMGPMPLTIAEASWSAFFCQDGGGGGVGGGVVVGPPPPLPGGPPPLLIQPLAEDGDN